MRGRAMQAPHPRLRALLRAVGDAPFEADEAGDVRFCLPDPGGQGQWLRLDEILLPSSVPAVVLYARTGFWHRSWGVVAERYLHVRLRGNCSRETAYAVSSDSRK